MTLEFALPPIDDDGRKGREATIGARVYESVRRAVIQLQFRPGNPLSEAQIARQLGVSRQPVREAFIKLAEVGLVEIRPQRGTFVRKISEREVANARFIREAIEVAIVSKAAAEATPADVARLDALIDRQRAAAATGDTVAFLQFDEQFHQTIAGSADCEDAWRMLEGLKAQMDRVRYLSLPDATPLETIIEQHEHIARAIARRAPPDAAQAMRQHLSEILISLPKLAADHPSFFRE
jgi:GntR family transcriptional regulator, rspAB operon transcriptional repressor